MTSTGWIEDVLVAPIEADQETWWSHYRDEVTGFLGDTALGVLDADCQYILEKGILGAGAAGSSQWPAHRVRSGLVMGSVQSGKTASMMGVIAKALDGGIDIVVVLAGTRLTLWRQTYERIRTQLDLEPRSWDDGAQRILVPSPAIMTATSTGPPKDLYRVQSKPGRRVVEGRAPLIAVVMKHDMHLQGLANAIRGMANSNAVDRPIHMLVIDDEADDGSILDAGVADKQIPHSVEQLWLPGFVTGESSFWEQLHVTYLAYTATPQANLLQAEVNPLSPRDFVCALRVPGPSGAISPRATEYLEPAGPSKHYTGGDVFYNRHRDLLVSVVPDDRDPLPDALRAYFVAGAHKILGDPKREVPSISRTKSYSSRGRASAYGPRAHTMLVHPSAKVADHFEVAAQILAWTHDLDQEAAVALLDSGHRKPDVGVLRGRLTDEEELWRSWHNSYINASIALAAHSGINAPNPPTWDEVRATLVSEVFPFTDVAVINSDEQADERPSFAPERTATDGWRPGRNLSTIFVSGNVMARGLTLEGLATSLFNRTSSNPLADTQMQMQRWFGYRGRDLHLTRLFIDRTQLELFAEYHLADVALRKQILAEMNSGNAAPEPTVFQGASFAATGKVANIQTAPFHPGRAPYFGGTNGADDPNNLLVKEIFSADAQEAWSDGVLRGLLRPDAISALEAADLLDRYAYRWRDAATDEAQRTRWENAAHLVDAPAYVPNLHLLRQPELSDGDRRDDLGLITPSAVAAYLRLWDAVHRYPSHGLVPMGRSPITSITGASFGPAPMFRVGLRYGGWDPCTSGVWSDSPIHPPMRRSGLDGDRVTTRWGSRRPDAPPGSYSSDEHFDLHALDEPVPAWDGARTGSRPEGTAGLILFQLVDVQSDSMPAVVLGVVLPMGGPNQFPAYVGGGSG